MRKPSRLRSMLAALCLAALALASCGGSETVAYYFYEVVCPSCEETQRMMLLASQIATWGESDKHVTAHVYDVFHATGDAFVTIERMSREHGLDPSAVALPILFAGGKAYRGAEEIEAFLAEL